jgi:hypothetical protein
MTTTDYQRALAQELRSRATPLVIDDVRRICEEAEEAEARLLRHHQNEVIADKLICELFAPKVEKERMN